MKMLRPVLVLTVINLVLMFFVISRSGRAAEQSAVPVLRGRALELVDEHGQIRSRLNVESNGEVVFRLLDKNGTIRVKLGADETGSALLFLDETTEPAVHIIARRTGTSDRPATTSIALTGANGQQRTITP